eukprot:gene37090-45758_t
MFMRKGRSSLVADAQLSKRKILAIYLLAVGLTSLFFYLIPPGYYNRNANLAISITMGVLMLLAAQRRLYSVLVHLATLSSLVLIIYIASQSGGINSTSIVWLNVLALPVLLLLGPAVTVIWIAVILSTILALYLATLNGWVDSQAEITQQAIPWALMNNMLAIGNLMLGVRFQPGEGAAFWFQVPLKVARTVQTPSTAVLSPLAQDLRILVIDDNSMNLMVARLQLQKCWPKAHIVTAESAAQALQLLDEQGFDVALIDMIMPDMDGMALTQQIRQQFPAMTARMPIIALTANTNPVDRQRCLDAGMDDVLAKPMDLSSLVN